MKDKITISPEFLNNVKILNLYSRFLDAIEADNRVEIDRLWGEASEMERLAMLLKQKGHLCTLTAKKGNIALLKNFWEIASKKLKDSALEALVYATFELAAEGGHLNVVIWLWRIAMPEQRDAMLIAALRKSAKAGKLEVVNFLFEVATPVQREDVLKYGFQEAAEGGHLDVVNFLFGVATPVQRADMLRVDLIDNAFDQAMDNGHYDVAKRLLEVATPVQRAAIIHHSAIFPYSPIIMAVRRGNLEMAKTLLAYICGTTFTSAWQGISDHRFINHQTKIELNSIEFQFELFNHQQAMQARSKEPVTHEVQATLRDGNLLIPPLVEIVTSYISHTTQDIIVEYKESYISSVSVQLVCLPQVHVPFIEIPYLGLTDARNSISTPTPPQQSQMVTSANILLREAMGLPPIQASSTTSSSSSSLSNVNVSNENEPKAKVAKKVGNVTPSHSISLKPSSSSPSNEQGKSL